MPALDLEVIFQDVAATKAALAAASRYARGLGARIRLLALQVVPYPLALDHPPAPVEFLERNLLTLASEQEIALAVDLYLCRDRYETLRQVLNPESIVFLKRERRWWPCEYARLGRLLTKDGHRVIQVPLGFL